MAAKTGQALANECIAYGFDSSYATRCAGWLTEACRDIARKFDPPLLRGTQIITTASGTPSYALPANFARVRSLRLDSTPSDLTPLEVRAFDELPPSQGYPQAYTVEVATLYLWPTPNLATTLTLRYTQLPTDIALDTNVSSLGEDLDPALIHYTVAQMYASEDDAQMHQFHLGEYMRIVNSVMSDERYQVGDGPRMVAGTWADLGEYIY